MFENLSFPTPGSPRETLNRNPSLGLNNNRKQMRISQSSIMRQRSDVEIDKRISEKGH